MGQGKGKSALVVGAGAAGLSAAIELVRAGWQVKILEASSRSGGRIWTDHSLGVPVDMGAAWLHGAGGGNPLVELFQKAAQGHFVSDSDSLALFDKGEEISDELYEALDEAYEEWMDEARSMKRRAQKGDSMELVLEENPESGFLKKGLRWQFASEVEIELAADADELSLKYWDEDEAFPGEEWLPRKGYGSLIDYLAQGLDIEYNTPVSSVSRTARGVLLQAGEKKYEADRAIITVSVGVLKSEAIRFDQGLSDRKRSALQRMKMGTMMKTVLEFPNSFWPDVHRMGLPSASDPILEFWNLEPVHGKPVLVALCAGSEARRLEKVSDRELQSVVMEQIRGMFGKTPEPRRMLRTRWHSSPLTRGSYSMIAAGSSLEDHATLGDPDDDRVFFAGEACHEQYTSTVHGAILSGRRAARAAAKA